MAPPHDRSGTRHGGGFFGPLLVLALLLALPARAAELKIATWNLNWLAGSGRAVPQEIHPRTEADFERLRAYAAELDADVIAIQEVDSGATALRLFPPDRYSVRMGRDHVIQRVGIVVRRGLPYDVNPDLAALALDPAQRLRSGVDITLRAPGGPLRLLAVHLKRGCPRQNLRRPAGMACNALHEQIAPLRDWVAGRAAEGVPFMLLGDFNREMEGRDPFMAELRTAAPLLRATEGQASPCWGAAAFIDHILLGGPARNWLKSGSLRVLVYKETGAEWKERLSDHCPVSVRLALPE